MWMTAGMRKGEEESSVISKVATELAGEAERVASFSEVSRGWTLLVLDLVLGVCGGGNLTFTFDAEAGMAFGEVAFRDEANSAPAPSPVE